MKKRFLQISTAAILHLLASCAGEITPNPITDDTPPVLQSFSPAENATDQARNLRIELQFDEQIQLESCNSNTIYITKEGDTAKIPIQKYVHPTESENNKLHIYLASELEPDTSYRITLNGAPKNQGGQPFAGKSWLFRTGGATVAYKPTLIISDPSNGQYIKESFTLTGIVSNAQSVACAVNNTNNWISISTNSDGTWSSPSLAPGSHPFLEGTNTIFVKATSPFGADFDITKQIKINVDTQAPTVAITSHADNDTIHTAATISGTVSDENLLSLEIAIFENAPPPFNTTQLPWTKLNATTIWSQAISISGLPSLGLKDCLLMARAIDKAGNTTTKTVQIFLTK